ncbi:SusD/RagB family nutrient-binding outer membrane lipoprotein [Rhodohalobacter sp. 614A]|uniref:SusD/RagB family nutrient-binding outer membrane lipoprotein n=1 Tax=Rhodohalobacter sp. 614A TaxID=2908649 RepID=UPI001F48AD26|nr:SusD/RagB family nutrient-binding outer membrane lipoprotein [Rhodohalobacter sp. 614A]
MKLSKLKITILLSGLLFFSAACEGFLDVNTDPTAPSEVPEDLQLSALLGVFSYQTIGNEPARTTNRWVQQLAWSGFPPSSDNYDFDESGPNNFWNSSYTVVLNNARELENLAEENGNLAYSGIAKVIQAWSFAILTDLWNEIPYTEAFDPANTTPAYDSQELVYSEVISLLEAALVDLSSESPEAPGSDDLLYGGDLVKWQKLANTLIARYQLRLTNAPGHSASEQANLALQALSNGFDSNSDDADFEYYDNAGEENPWYQFAIDGKWDTRDQLSDHYINLLKDLDDPRLPIQARPVGAVNNSGLVPGFDPDTVEYAGNVNGSEGDGAGSYSSIGAFYSDADSPLTWASYAEAKFIEAEATYIAQGAASAQDVYEEAIRASMSKLGVSQEAADSYIASLGPLAASANPLEDIIVQKYIANFLSLENYNDWRRTGYPELEPAVDPYTPSGEIPVRYPYPTSELQNNAESVSSTGIPVGYGSLDINVWWDSQN